MDDQYSPIETMRSMEDALRWVLNALPKTRKEMTRKG